MNYRYHLSRLLTWPLDRLLRMRRFPLLRTFYSRQHWLYDVCRYAGTRDFKTLFDVGANTGQTAEFMQKFFPRATIHAFEPVTETFLELQRHAARWPSVRPHRLALGQAEESREIVLQFHSVMNSLSYRPGLDTAPTAKIERIEITTLDRFCAAHGLEFIDVLKIDAQGNDIDVVAGGAHLVASAGIPFIFVEVGFQPDDAINTPFAALDPYLVSCGYRLSGFYEPWGYELRGGWLGFCNALYIHPAALQRRFQPRPN